MKQEGSSWRCCARTILLVMGVLVAARIISGLLITTVLRVPPGWNQVLLEAACLAALAAPYLCWRSRGERCRLESAETEVRCQAQSQAALYDIAHISFGDLAREDFLGRVIDRLLGVEWLGLEPRAAIFLADREQRSLALRAYRGYEQAQDLCTQIAFGECFCGRAAAGRKVESGGCEDADHARRCPRAGAHCHCAIPIFTGELCLGVLQVQWKPGRFRNGREVQFLQAAAGLIAGILARRAAEEDRRRLATAIEQASESVIITDPRGTIQYVNPGFTRLSGYSRAESLGQTPRLLRSGRHGPELYEALWRTIGGGSIWEGRLTDKKKDGTLFESDLSITPVKDLGGRIINFVAVSRDITALSAMEDQVRRAQKMQAVGLLAGGIAHDFNNVLTTIVGYNYFILEGLETGHPLRSFSLEIRRSAELAGSLTHQLLALGRHQVLQPQVMDANSVILSLGRMLKRLVGENIEVELDTHPALWPVKMDSGQLEQVVLNLVINARDAMPNGGRLVLATRNLTAHDDHRTDPAIVLPPGQYVCLEVSDTGSGIDESVRAHLFEPFFTTKGPGRGTGLGLATIMGIVKQYGGHIAVQSARGRGTAFRIYLSRVAGGVQAMVPGTASKAAKGGHETVLIVEDNDALRAIIRKALREKGYRVFSARNSQDALALCGRLKERIDLLLADVVLPDLDGPELAKRLLEQRSGLKVAFMSGYPAGMASQLVQLQDAAHIDKPFSPEQLLGFVRRALDAAQIEMI
jgi:PAS domain S-box-containing protein